METICWQSLFKRKTQNRPRAEILRGRFFARVVVTFAIRIHAHREIRRAGNDPTYYADSKDPTWKKSNFQGFGKPFKALVAV